MILRLSDMGPKFSFDRSRPCLTYSAGETWGRLPRAGTICRYYWKATWSISCVPHATVRGQPPNALNVLKSASKSFFQLHTTWSSVLSSAWTWYRFCVTPEVILQGCDSRWWAKEGCLLLSLQRTGRKGRGRHFQGFHCVSSFYYHHLCQLLDVQGPFRLCICKNTGRFIFFFFCKPNF